jgi:hypothetical protein
MKTKKKLTIPIFYLIITMLFVLTISAQTTRPILSISEYKADSGNLDTTDTSFDLKITLKNSGDYCARDAAITVQVTPPFMIDDTPTSEPEDICTDEEEITIPLKLQSDVVGGSYPLTLTVTYSDDAHNVYSFTNIITIFINGDSELNAHIISSNPLKIYSGDTVTLSVLIENDGTFKAETIKGTLSANYPINVIQSQSFVSIGTLDSRQSSVSQFSVEIPRDAEALSYPMTLSLQYIEDGRTKSKDIPLNLIVEKKALFEATSSSSTPLYPNSAGKTLNVNIKNTGTDIANDIKIQIQPQFPFTTDGSIRYLNTLAPGETKPVQFVVNIDKAATTGNYALDLIINFKDLEGNPLTDTITAKATVQKENIFRVIFANYWYIWFILEIVILIILMRAYRRSHKKA